MQTRSSFDFTTQTHTCEERGGQQEGRGEEKGRTTQDKNHKRQKQRDDGQSKDTATKMMYINTKILLCQSFK